MNKTIIIIGIIIFFFSLLGYIQNIGNKKRLQKLNDFIKVRGGIAHNGSKSKYVRFNTLLNNIETIVDNAIQIDYSLSQHLKTSFLVETTWEESYHKKLSSYK